MDFNSQIKPMQEEPLNIEALYRVFRFTPNEKQEQAIRHLDGPLYLAAGPGSGKTRVLLWRTLNLIVFHDVQPEEIFLATFTEKAAQQLNEGLRSLLGLATNLTGRPYDITQMYIGTVHSLCQRILTDRRRFSQDRQRNRPPKLLDELGQYFHLARSRTWTRFTALLGNDEDPNGTINNIFMTPSRSKHVAVTNLLSFFNRFSEELIDPSMALEKLKANDKQIIEFLKVQDIPASEMEIALRFYQTYLETLKDSAALPLTDFALLQKEAYDLLSQSDAAGKVFKHVIVDEYQDTNTIQERIFFQLAQGSGNLCVVGDDDQALYRFRGATVENFVEFPVRCQTNLKVGPTRIDLDTNYRSQNRIVSFYRRFMDLENWSRLDGAGGEYRVSEKKIEAYLKQVQPAVVATTPGKPDDIYPEIVQLCKDLLAKGKVEDPNQIAFLFPSMKSQGQMAIQVERMKRALEAAGLPVYAPRAGRFLEVDEAYDIFGLFVQVFGRPARGDFLGRDYSNFMDWLDQIEAQGKGLMKADPHLKQFVEDRRRELERVASDYQALMAVCTENRWEQTQPYDLNLMKRALYAARGLSDEGKRLIGSRYLDRLVEERIELGNPFSLDYIIKRATSLDWNVLDLFYRFCGFEYFKQMFDAAEQGRDEGPMSNFGLITQYLARFADEYRTPVITADLLLEDKLFQRVFFMSFLYSLYRLGEAEFEDAEDPFPKGRIPFLTIHQAKGLEFPVVILPNPRKNVRPPGRVEVMARPFLQREEGEPLDRMGAFDMMRMFYVALSRAKNLLVIAHLKGPGQSMNEPFKELLNEEDVLRIPSLNLDEIPEYRHVENDLPRTYSFTSDFLAYRKCARQYMVFNRFGFVPSRSQTMIFGSLVHRTLEDLHHELIRRRETLART